MADPRFFAAAGPLSLGHLAALCGARLERGDPAATVSGVAPLSTATGDDLSFIDNRKYLAAFRETRAGACLVAPELVAQAPDGVALLVATQPYRAYGLCAAALHPEPWPEPGIHPAAHVDPTARLGSAVTLEPGAVILAGAEIGDGCWIEANATIGRGVVLGARCRIGANASVSHALLGARVRLYPGARVGQDGFGFAIGPEGFQRIPQLGRVVIGDDVEVGANSTIDRGAGPDTVIGAGTMIDNLVQIGHNVVTGRNCVLIAQSGVAGSTRLGDFVVLAAQSGVAGHLTLASGVRIGVQSGVMRDIALPGDYVGQPVMPAREFWREKLTLSRLAADANAGRKPPRTEEP